MGKNSGRSGGRSAIDYTILTSWGFSSFDPGRITDVPLPPEARRFPQTTTTSVTQDSLQKAPETGSRNDPGGPPAGRRTPGHTTSWRSELASLPASKFKLRPRPRGGISAIRSLREREHPAPSSPHRHALGRRRETFVYPGRTTASPE